jgi:EAL domain-containing protein (putative c-di-GMP-specific phosphodiesterase class I)
VEALLRWRQHNDEVILPGDFIAAAETSGLINQLGQWVIRQACDQHQLWRKEGLPSIRISINVSPMQFRSRSFQTDIALALADTGIDPSCVELEVTESTVMSQVEDAVDTLGKLKKLGVRIALDDFGTGYSSLSHLSYLPIDKLKVDQSFIQNIDTNARSLAITETVIALGKKLNVEVVAEGIESEKALRLLSERECTLGQGYLIGKPMPSESFVKWFHTQYRPEVYH